MINFRVSNPKKALVNSINEAKNVTSLVLENCQLTREPLSQLQLRSKSLAKLDLSGNKMGDCGAELAQVSGRQFVIFTITSNVFIFSIVLGETVN